MDAVENAVEGKMSQDAQPGNQFEGTADNAANQGTMTQYQPKLVAVS